ncbi:MAG: GH116 family glycosyl hydrolase [Candidatus Omnitrophica bacterium]|nr:GH116 family glycosyl hydrolase [Candidatus Omnitrophota bacterium]
MDNTFAKYRIGVAAIATARLKRTRFGVISGRLSHLRLGLLLYMPLAVAVAVVGSPLFEAPADRSHLQKFHVDGFQQEVCGEIIGADSLEQGGMPLGGVGAGYLCIDPDGRLGKTSIFNRFPAPVSLNQPFLTLSAGGRQVVLATPKKGVGGVKAIDYFGHFPVADARFHLDLPLRVELRAYSPFIPGDAVESETPAAVFEVSVENLSDQEQSIELAFSPGGFPEGESQVSSLESWAAVQVTHRPLEKLPDWVRHSYAMAVENGAAEAGSKAVRVFAKRAIGPREQTAVRFILAWYQPYLREGSGRVERHFYSTRFANVRAVLVHAIKARSDWFRRVLAWQEVIYGSDLPDWLKEALVNAPYALAKNSLWLARTRSDDWWDDKGLFLVNESFSTCPLTETMPCRFFGHWPALFFFPELELSTLKAIRHFQLRDGEPPFCMGMGLAIRDPRYHCQHTGGAGEYAQMIYRYYLRTGDRQFFQDFWPSARDALRFMLWLDRDGDGLVEDHAHNIEGETFPANNPLDQWPWHGVSSYTAGKGLAALVCGIKMAELAGDQAQAAEWQKALNRGRKVYDEKLWTGTYYRTYNDTATGRRNDSCFAAQLSGIWCTRVLGLEDALPHDRVRHALDTIARLNLPASKFGMMDAVFPDGTPCIEGGPPHSIWSRGIFIQCNATAAMVYLYQGRRDEGAGAAQRMLDTVFRGPHAMPWAQPCGLDSQTGGSCHGHDYYDHMVVWSYPLAFRNQDIRAACAPGGMIQQILQAASR